MSDFDTYQGTLTVNGGTVVVDCQNTTGVYCNFSGAAHAGLNVAFEGTADGGTTWQSLLGYRIDSAAVSAMANSTGTLTTNSNTQWYVIVGAMKQFRARASAYTSGSLGVMVMTVRDANPISTMLSPFTAPGTLADGATNGVAGQTGSLAFLYNGTTWDRNRNHNSNVAVDASTARTATGTGTTATNYNHAGAFILTNVTAVSGTTPTLLVRVQYSIDGTNFHDLDTTNAQTASITATGLYVLKVYPDVTPAANAAVNSPLPRVWRLAWTIGGTTPSFTFSTTASYIL